MARTPSSPRTQYIDSTRALMLLLLTLCSVGAWWLNRRFPNTVEILPAFLAGRYPWLSACLVATFVTNLATLGPHERRRLLWWAIPCEATALLPTAVGGQALFPFGCGLTAVSLMYRAVRISRFRGETRVAEARVIFDSLVPTWFGVVSPTFLDCTGLLMPSVHDLTIQALGGPLGPWPPIFVARVFSQLPLLRMLCMGVYFLLPIGLALAHAAAWRRDRSARPRLLLAFVLLAYSGYALYFVVPMVGPRETWQFFAPHVAFPPQGIPALPVVTFEPSASVPRNCMPSLHTAWSLAIYLETRRFSRAWGVFGLSWFVCTELATLGSGEHWLIDLVVAIPFALLVYAIAANSLRTRRARWAGTGLAVLTGAWLVALATEAVTLRAYPVLVGLAMLLTLPLSGMLGYALRLPCGSRGRVLRGAIAPEHTDSRSVRVVSIPT